MLNKEPILTIRRVLLTFMMVIGYSVTWMILELLLDGEIVDRPVDSIIMLLFVPIIYIATGPILKGKDDVK